MTTYTYDPLDLSKQSIRLVRLLNGTFGDDLLCEIFQTWLHQAEGLVPYEALSYTWGNAERTAAIHVGQCTLEITPNLHEALQRLRLPDEDRIFWIDAISIDQGNIQERGHQVQHMRDIYKEAEQVLIWLGPATLETDSIMVSMQKFHRWLAIATARERSPTTGRLAHLQQLYSTDPTSSGMYSLLHRPWFKRNWILQEVASARVATVVCGSRSISARTFALVPSILQLEVPPHCQVVLDIMPGLSRSESWWGHKRDLHTLLVKFADSEATDTRDKIYALLGISSDAADSKILRPDYSKSFRVVLRDTMWFLLFHEAANPTVFQPPDWNISHITQGLSELRARWGDWAVREGHVALVQQLYNDQEFGEDRVPGIFLAVEQGKDRMLEFLLAQKDINVNLKSPNGLTPLSLAVGLGREVAISLLLAKDNIDVNCQDNNGRTPLLASVDIGNMRAFRSLMEATNINFDLMDNRGRTPLLASVEVGNELAFRSLLMARDININLKDNRGRTPLTLAVQKSQDDLVLQLLRRKDFDIDSRDNTWRTPLSIALRTGHHEIASLHLSEMERRLGYDDPFILDVVRDIMSSYKKRRKTKEIERLLSWAVSRSDVQELFQQGLPPRPAYRSLTAVVSDVATFYADQGELAKARQICIWALPWCERFLGYEHTSTSVLLNILRSFESSPAAQISRKELAQMYWKALTLMGPTADNSERPSTLDMVREFLLTNELYQDWNEQVNDERIHSLVVRLFEQVLDSSHTSIPRLIENLKSTIKQGDLEIFLAC